MCTRHIEIMAWIQHGPKPMILWVAPRSRRHMERGSPTFHMTYRRGLHCDKKIIDLSRAITLNKNMWHDHALSFLAFFILMLLCTTHFFINMKLHMPSLKGPLTNFTMRLHASRCVSFIQIGQHQTMLLVLIHFDLAYSPSHATQLDDNLVIPRWL